MLNRIGWASFRYGLREHPALFKAAQVYLKLCRPRERLKFVLDTIAKGLTDGEFQECSGGCWPWSGRARGALSRGEGRFTQLRRTTPSVASILGRLTKRGN